MSIQSVGFIGSGRVARILLCGWKHAQAMPPRCVVFDPNSETTQAIQAIDSSIKAGAAAEASAQDLVFLAVHPPMIKDAVTAIKGGFKSNTIIVSLAPKFTIAALSTMLDGFNRIARVIPNAPSIVGRGYNPVAFSPQLEAGEKEGIQRLLAALGDCPEVEERHLEAYAILSAMGPTYFWPQFYELKSLGESFGLTSEAAMEALDKMLWGAVASMKESGLTPEQVCDLVPVKPMADDVATLVAAYGQKLNGLIEKIRP